LIRYQLGEQYSNWKNNYTDADTDNVKVVISRGQIVLSNLHKIGKCGKKIGEKSGKLLIKSGKIGTFT